MPIGASTGGYNIDFHTFRDIVPDQIGARIRAERINNWLDNNPLVQSMDLAFYTSYGFDQTQLTEKLRIKSNGYVGIGTASPDELLAVDGNIHAKEVKVDLTGWEDKVFKRTYKLPELSTVKTYIYLNHHLPDMPSESELMKTGLNLGNMEKILTKKVEELTLYMIEKDKQVSEEQEQLEKQKKINESLQNQLDLIKKQFVKQVHKKY